MTARCDGGSALVRLRGELSEREREGNKRAVKEQGRVWRAFIVSSAARREGPRH